MSASRSRSFFLTVSGIAHVVFGVVFLVFSTEATQCVVRDPPARSVLLVRGLGGIVVSFGLLNLLARHVTDRIALRAILVGTLTYLVSTTAFDAWWALQDYLLPAAWTTIMLRVLLIMGYAVHLIRSERGSDAR